MNKLDEILYKRLEKIREKLDSYIAEKIEEECSLTKALIEAPMGCHSVGETVAKLSESLLIPEDDEDFELADEEDEIRPVSRPVIPATPTLPVPQFLRADKSKSDLDKVLENKAETFSSMLLRLIDEKGLKDSEVYKKANIDRRLFSKIRGDEEYVPSKKTAISFCLALQLDMDEAKKLLKTAGYALSEASRFDLIIMYLIDNNEYNIHFANIVLNDYGEGTLSK